MGLPHFLTSGLRDSSAPGRCRARRTWQGPRPPARVESDLNGTGGPQRRPCSFECREELVRVFAQHHDHRDLDPLPRPAQVEACEALAARLGDARRGFRFELGPRARARARWVVRAACGRSPRCTMAALDYCTAALMANPDLTKPSLTLSAPGEQNWSKAVQFPISVTMMPSAPASCAAAAFRTSGT